MATKKLYDIDAYKKDFTAEVLSCRELECKVEGETKDVVYEVVLDQTCFFPEEGGQTPDKGTIAGVEVLDVQIQKDNTILHRLAGAVEVGTQVVGEIDWQHRFSLLVLQLRGFSIIVTIHFIVTISVMIIIIGIGSY